MFAPDTANCLNCQFETAHTEAEHTKSVRWSKALAVDLELGRKAPASRPSQILPRARRGMLFGGV
jgi:hypothetical protein